MGMPRPEHSSGALCTPREGSNLHAAKRMRGLDLGGSRWWRGLTSTNLEHSLGCPTAPLVLRSPARPRRPRHLVRIRVRALRSSIWVTAAPPGGGLANHAPVQAAVPRHGRRCYRSPMLALCPSLPRPAAGFLGGPREGSSRGTTLLNSAPIPVSVSGVIARGPRGRPPTKGCFNCDTAFHARLANWTSWSDGRRPTDHRSGFQ